MATNPLTLQNCRDAYKKTHQCFAPAGSAAHVNVTLSHASPSVKRSSSRQLLRKSFLPYHLRSGHKSPLNKFRVLCSLFIRRQLTCAPASISTTVPSVCGPHPGPQTHIISGRDVRFPPHDVCSVVLISNVCVCVCVRGL